MSLIIADSIQEILDAMASGARPVAGGSDLVVGARQGNSLPEALVAIDRVDELAEIAVTAEGIRIGAGVTHATVMGHAAIVEGYTGLADASALVGSPATRNVGTIGGNVMNGSPAMDTGAPLLVMGGQAELQSSTGIRMVSLADLWTGPGQTSAASNELCVAVHLDAAHSGSAYVRLEYRRAMEIAVVGAGASVVLADDGSLTSARIALTAVAPTILEVSAHELAGLSPDAAANAAASLASEQALPISDLRGSDKYRRHTVGIMAKRAIDAACRRADGENISVPVNRSVGIGATR